MSLRDYVMAGIKKHKATHKKVTAPDTEKNETGEGGDEAEIKKVPDVMKKKATSFKKMNVNGEGYAAKIANALMAARVTNKKAA